MPAEAGIQSFQISEFPLETRGNDEMERDQLRNPGLGETREARPIYAASQFDKLLDGKDFRAGGGREIRGTANAAATDFCSYP